MSLSLALNNALTGLRINQQSIGVLSQNIANVNTEGYSRQVLNQSAIDVGGVGSGVRIEEITRKIDKYLQRSVQTQSSTNATAQTLSGYYVNLQSLLGQPGASNSIDTFMTSYFNAVQQLAETPQTTSLKANAISAGSAFAKQLSDLAANVHDLRQEADRGISDAVSEINSSLDRLKAINNQLAQSNPLAGQSNAGLLDSRDRELAILSGFMDISTSFDPRGAVTVVGGNGNVLLEEGVRHQLQYTKAASLATFTEDGNFSPILVLTLNDSNQQIGQPQTLMTGGTSAQVKNNVAGGTLAGLQQIRDQKFPAILDQLDMMASRLRDNVNALHNSGSGFPPATVLTGDRTVFSSDQFEWQGQVRIAVLQPDGTPAPSYYTDEAYTGIRALTMDMSKLNSGQGNGYPTLQTIVDEINNHFGAPGNKAVIGNMNNVQMVSDTNILPSGSPPLFNFDLDLENISSTNSTVFVTGISVVDDTATNITNVTQTAPSISIQPANSYITTTGSADVTINLTATPTVQVGDRIYLNPPSAAVNGIAPAALTGFFTVTAVSGNTVTFTSGGIAAATGPVNDGGNIQMMEPYTTVIPGQKTRTRDQGTMQLDFSGNVSSSYYDVTVNVTTIDGAGVLTTAPVTYRVNNNTLNQYNVRYDAQAVGAPGTLVLPGTSQDSIRAILVDDNGLELPKVNGRYIEQPAHLKLVGGNGGTYGIAIDDLTSTQLGKPANTPAEPGTNWGFSHYFGLNNFFSSNKLVTTGDTVKGSAYSMKVEDRLIQNGNLISTGKLVQQQKSSSTNGRDVYTYARYEGDNTVAQAIAKLNTQVLEFNPAGGLPYSQQSLQSYTSELMGYVAQRSTEAKDNAANAQILYDGFKSKSEAISGVNLDEELANTVVFQNAYSATARIITTVNKMYEDLMQSF